MEVMVVALLVLLAGARSQNHGDSGLASGLRLVRSAYRQCQQGGHLLACLQLRALKVVDRALGAERIPLLDGVELVRTNEVALPRGEGLAPLDEEHLSQDPAKLGTLLMDRAAKFLDTHSVRINHRRLFGDDEEDSMEEGRGKKKKKLKKAAGLLLLAAGLKAGLLALATKGVAALAAAALATGTIALVLAAINGLAALLGRRGGEESTTYEIVKHPHVSHVKTHSSSHEHVDEHHEEDHHQDGGGDFYYESRVGGAQVQPAYRRYFYSPPPDYRAHPLAYRRQPGPLKTAGTITITS